MAKGVQPQLIKEETFNKLKELAEKRGLTMREVAMDDSHPDFEIIVDIFYSNMPKHYKWFMPKPKFRDFFIKNREMMLNAAKL